MVPPKVYISLLKIEKTEANAGEEIWFNFTVNHDTECDVDATIGKIWNLSDKPIIMKDKVWEITIEPKSFHLMRIVSCESVSMGISGHFVFPDPGTYKLRFEAGYTRGGVEEITDFREIDFTIRGITKPPEEVMAGLGWGIVVLIIGGILLYILTRRS